ncbi:MAG: hypothetical protein QM817_06985 [Archangium sp.]
MRRVIAIVLGVLTIGAVWRVLSNGPRVRPSLVPHRWEPRLGEGGTLRASAGGVEFWREDESHFVIERAGRHVRLPYSEAEVRVARRGAQVVAVIDQYSYAPGLAPLYVLIIGDEGVDEFTLARPLSGSLTHVATSGERIVIELHASDDEVWDDVWTWPWRRSALSKPLPLWLQPTVGHERVFVQSSDAGRTWVPLTDLRAWWQRR